MWDSLHCRSKVAARMTAPLVAVVEQPLADPDMPDAADRETTSYRFAGRTAALDTRNSDAKGSKGWQALQPDADFVEPSDLREDSCCALRFSRGSTAHFEMRVRHRSAELELSVHLF